MTPTTIVAEMADGTCLVEHVTTFEDFTAIVLPLRADSECERVTWHALEGMALIDALAAEMTGMLAEAQEAVWRASAALVLSGEVA